MNKSSLQQIVFRSLILVILGCVLGSCASPSTQVGAFGKAASEASESIQNALTSVDQTTVNRKLSEIAISNDRPVITADTFKGLFNEEAQLKPRLEVLKQLENYSKALGELATADFREDIDNASKNLYGALSGLSSTYNRATGHTLPVDDDDLMIVATALDAIGSVIVEAKRQHAIRQIVVQFDPMIQKVSGYLAKELPSLYSGIVRANLQAVGDDMAAAYKREAQALNYQERMSALRLVGQAKQAPLAAPAMFTAAGKAAEEIGAAHAALKEAAIHKKLTSKALVTHIRSLVATAESVKNFYEKLRTKE